MHCETCGASSIARFCSEACRLKEWRQRQAHHRDLLAMLQAQRARLSVEAAAALVSGDVTELTAVAQRAADLLRID